MVGLVFLTSGWNHLRDPAGRSKDIGLSKRFTIFLGTVELAGSGDNPWRFCPARCRQFNLDNARGDPKEDFRLAHWLLGEIRDKWVELRHHAPRDESGDSHNRRWKSLARKVPRIALIRRETRTQSVVPAIPT